MITTGTQKIGVIAFMVILLTLLGYYMYSGVQPSVADLAVISEGASSQDITELESKINSIVVDKSIFSSVLFTSLVDFSIPLTPEPQGRPNPFAKIGSDGTSVSVPPKSSGQ